MKQTSTTGHLLAFITTLFWGTTFIATKTMLADFQPVEILFFRFVVSLVALVLMYPHRLKWTGGRRELMFAAAGLTGITLYYLLENIALTYTLASNVGVIVSISPFLAAMLTRFFLKHEERLRANFYIGFIAAMVGICLISFNGASLHLNPLGDLLSAAAALFWAIYTVLIRTISGYGYNTIQVTRRTFSYGILFMIPALFLFDFRLDLGRFAQPRYLFTLAFLGLGAGAVCFVTWNLAVKILGAVKTCIYIYLVPVVTIITSVLILREPLTGLAVLGTLLTLSGLVISELRLGYKKQHSD